MTYFEKLRAIPQKFNLTLVDGNSRIPYDTVYKRIIAGRDQSDQKIYPQLLCEKIVHEDVGAFRALVVAIESFDNELMCVKILSGGSDPENVNTESETSVAYQWKHLKFTKTTGKEGNTVCLLFLLTTAAKKPKLDKRVDLVQQLIDNNVILGYVMSQNIVVRSHQMLQPSFQLKELRTRFRAKICEHSTIEPSYFMHDCSKVNMQNGDGILQTHEGIITLPVRIVKLGYVPRLRLKQTKMIVPTSLYDSNSFKFWINTQIYVTDQARKKGAQPDSKMSDFTWGQQLNTKVEFELSIDGGESWLLLDNFLACVSVEFDCKV
jgi:Trp operon repressor